MSFSLTVLGCSGKFPTADRAASGYLLEHDGKNIWVDAGAGTWRNLITYIDYPDLDGVLLSHRHPDHTSDVFMAIHARLFGERHPLPRIPLWAPSSTIKHMSAYFDSLEGCFEIHEIADGDRIEVAGLGVDLVRMAHPPATLGMRLSDGDGVLAYSADTGPDADLRRLAGGADIFVCEATLQDSDKPWEGHLSASQAGAIAAELGVGELVLTHLPPERDLGLSLAEAQRTCGDARVRLAVDGLRLEVG